MPFLIPFIIQAVIALAISAAITLAFSLLFPQRRPQQQQQQSAVPKPEDGKYAFKQNVPSLPVVLGRVKKPGDYVFLEERQGQAFHGMVMAGHRIEGFVQHYLHDEATTFSGGGIVTPAHFVGYVGLEEKLGLDLQVASTVLTTWFPEIWTAAHRGDGLAYCVLNYATAAQEKYTEIYPQQMPQHSAVVDGAWLYDPRTNQDPGDPETWSFSTNLALERLWHLTHPTGGKLSLDDMHLPDWSAAATIADQVVLNREEEEEPRYHGGLWYRADNDQVEIGRLLDEAGEMVLYERADGKIGVHPGVLVTPDIRITAADILSFRYDANKRLATNVLAVRGRLTDPDAVYNTVDAAIYGEPYTGEDTQRTKTVDNQAVQYHNHMQRLQKLAFIRANAPRVSLVIVYDAFSATRFVRYRRFVRVHLPGRDLDEAIVEIIGRPKLSLQNLTYTFDAIVVPATLYSFDAATEEGVRGTLGEAVEPTGVPVPENFAIGIAAEVVTAGQTQAYGVASWDHLSDALNYELEWQLADESAPPQSVMSKSGETEARTQALADGATYRFRLRAWSNGAPSDWTAYETELAVADTVAPGQPDDFDSVAVGSTVTLSWTNPNSPNLYRTELYRGSTGSFGSAVLIYTSNGGIAEPRSYDDPALAAGTYYWWLVSKNASGVPALPVGPETQTI
ncbi:hypothetical protein [Reyranella sp.]|uniref:hypothetical protein n=1 Tax=Reyranella sp. TaxID=1929291 RepID=UPI003F71A32B